MKGSYRRRTSPRTTSYSGLRQPHKSRRGRILSQSANTGDPGPGSYQIGKIRATSPRSPRASFGSSPRFQTSNRTDVSKYGTPVPLIIRPALGEQIVSTRRTLGSTLFGKGSRAAATLCATRTGIAGVDSPGPIYHPLLDSRAVEKRYGVRPEFSARERMSNFQRTLDTNSMDSVRSSILERPSTSQAQHSASMIRSKLDAECSLDIGYDRPGTSFGRSRRPPLYSKDRGNIPGPKYENIKGGERALSTDPTKPRTCFGKSTRAQRKKMRIGVEDTSAMGTSSPGPGAYFTGGNKQVEIAEKNTESSFGPSFSIRIRTPFSLFAGSQNESRIEYDPRSRPSKEERKRWRKPLRASMGRQIEGRRKTSPRFQVGLTQRFGNVNGFSVGKR